MRVPVIVCVSFMILSMIAPSVYAASSPHACAPSTPPAVAGPLLSPPATYHSLFINEVLPFPNSIWNCSEMGAPASTSHYSDAWVELYNPQNQPFDLYAARTSFDSGPGTNPFYFPLGSAIAAHGFLVIFPRSSWFSETEASLLRLLIGGAVIDQVTLPAQVPTDASYARIADGSPTWQICDAPTIDASNTPPAPTPTPPASTRSSGISGGWIDTGKGKLVSGKQPLWSALQLPASTSFAAASTPAPAAASATAPASSRGAIDIPHKILLTLLVAALALALLWCWRLFQPS